jgi:hypothetical protein
MLKADFTIFRLSLNAAAPRFIAMQPMSQASVVPELSFGMPFPWVFVDGELVAADDARLSVLANVVSYGGSTGRSCTPAARPCSAVRRPPSCPSWDVDHRPVGDGRPSEVTVALQRSLRTIARHENGRRHGWTTPVYEELS